MYGTVLYEIANRSKFCYSLTHLPINLFILLLSLAWSFLRLTKLHFVVLAQLLLTALGVDSYLYERIMILISIVWIIFILKPLYSLIRNLIK